MTLNDTADLEGGLDPTGTIAFTLVAPGGGTVNTETVTVNGDGIYSTPTGFTPSGPNGAGTYQWNATYSGDSNNSSVSDVNNPTERVTVSSAIPTLATIPNPDTVELGATPVTLNDAAQLIYGYNPTGTITFTLVAPGGGTVDTETVTVNGNGIYTTPTGFTLPTTGTATGTYQWTATYSGDSNNSSLSDNDATAERVTVIDARPTVITFPSPRIVTLGATPVTLKDVAVLQSGFNPTGTITFTLFFNGGSTPVDTESVTINGNGIYRTPTGFTLPTTGTVTGAYQWAATYSGDSNNSPVNDNSDDFPEQVTVGAASPTIVTTANPTGTITLGTTSPTLNDTADLENGYHPTGTLLFTLKQGGATVFTQSDAVTGNGTYTTAGFTLQRTGSVTGTYTWTANYEGDGNNAAATDQGGVAEQTVVGAASLALVTIASPNLTLPTGPPGTVTLSDSAFLSGGLSPTGSIVFTLTGPGGFSYTQPDTVSGNGSYTASTTLPTTRTVAGTYAWTAHYSGDANNNPANDQGGIAEQTVVSPASPTVVTTADPLAATLGTTSPTLNDTADLENGYHPTGTLLFTLKQGGATVFTQSDAVSGNGAYTTAGFTLPTTGTGTGTYTWTVAYDGDGNNAAANDQGGPAEQTVVSPASPMLVTTAGSAITQRATRAPTLSDTALLSGGYFPTGSIVFTLTGPNAFSFTDDITVSGNGAYTASTTLPTTVAGTYTWTARYGGDPNNNAASDQGGSAERVTVSPASPTLATTPIDFAGIPTTTVTLPTGPPGTVTLHDSAELASGTNPTGSITFTLVYNNTTVDTETVTVNGNGAYTTPTGFTLPSSGAVTGAYQWDATYSGDTNNNAASDVNDAAEQVTVSAASPTITTTPSPKTVTLGATSVTLTDSALLAGGFHPTGAITFMLFQGSTLLDTETVAVNGNGTYTTPTGFTLPGCSVGWPAPTSGTPPTAATPTTAPSATSTRVSRW